MRQAKDKGRSVWCSQQETKRIMAGKNAQDDFVQYVLIEGIGHLAMGPAMHPEVPANLLERCQAHSQLHSDLLLRLVKILSQLFQPNRLPSCHGFCA
jgi:hypothetical protein